jgi:hypothetical protein
MANKKAQTQTGPRAIRAIFEDAKRAAEDEHAHVVDPDPNQPRMLSDGTVVKAGQWPGAPDNNMPPDHPVAVIGRNSAGTEYYFRSATGHFRTVTKWDMPSLTDLYAPYTNTLKWCWPAFGKKKVPDPDAGEDGAMKEITIVKRVERDQAMQCLMNAAARMPDFDPVRQHRGRGGWKDSQERFIWHSGAWLWTSVNGKLERARPLSHDGYLYTRQPATIDPWAEPVAQAESPARRILEDLRTWNWQRPYLDPLLVLGWIGTALMCGALKARPIVFTTGGAGVGKSTLHELITTLLQRIVTTSVNATAAFIYQTAQLDALPFLVDELESKSGSTRAESIIELARVAYTGGNIGRGGQDHQATSFTARQSFFFSAINAPPMGAQDKTRMAMLNLGRLDARDGIGKAVTVAPETDARMMLRQVMDGWPDFNGRALQSWYETLAPHGLDSRAIDTYGTLLAAAELLVGPEALEDCGLPIAESDDRLGAMIAEATRVDRTESLDNWHKCLDHLLQSSINEWREGVKPTIGSVCEQLRLGPSNGGWDAAGARERLQLVNLGAVDRGKARGADNLGPCLAVPADGPALQRIFGDTEFHKGVWYTALKQAPQNIVVRNLGNGQKVKINGSVKNCLLVDLEAFERFTSVEDQAGQ